MAKASRTSRQYHCEAIQADGSSAVLYTWAESPGRALAMSRETWNWMGIVPTRIVLRDYDRHRVGALPVVQWSANDDQDADGRL